MAGVDGGMDADASGDAIDATDTSEVNPDASEVNPDASEVNPDASEVQPEVHPDASEVQPDASEVQPDTGEVGSAGTDGGAGDGGGGTGGGGTGGAGTGGAGMGGMAGIDAGTDAPDAADGPESTDVPVEVTPPPPACYQVTFTKPLDNAQLSAADDKSGDQCVDGFQYDVIISTTAPDGTVAQLFGGATLLQMAAASGGVVTFSNVQLASSAATNLSIQFPSTMPCTDPTTKARVVVDCSVPTCTVSKPVISPAHPKLNGVPAAQGGDRVSANGSTYQAAFEVTTNIADNQTVFLDVDNAASSSTVTTLSAHALGGKATFAGVSLAPDGTYEVQGRCVDGNNVVGRSAKGTYIVDTTPPDLTVSKPHSFDFIGPGGLPGGVFQVCGSTTATDAVGLGAGLGTRQANYCVATTGAPTCVAVPAGAVGMDTCVGVPCPGDAPFNVTVTLSDEAGNPQTTVLTGITCSSALPTVQIITPVTDSPMFNDPSRHLLAATAPQSLRDQDGATPGAQTDVVACTSRAGTAALFAGHASDMTLTQVGASAPTMVATAADGCPAGLGFVVRFAGATVPESLETATGALASATRLRVDLTDQSAAVGQGVLDLWVDSVPPAIALTSPAGLCGSFHQAFATFDTDLVYTTDTPSVTATIANGGVTDTLTNPTFASGTATFTAITFAVGQNDLAAVATDLAGNTASAATPCTVTVGMAPVVVFDSPTAANELCAAGATAANCIPDTDAAAGWQGALAVHVLANGVPVTSGTVTFSLGATVLGDAALDNTGHAVLPGVTLLDGTVTITATTSDIANHGIGTVQVTVIVDTGPPDVLPNLDVSVLDRRQTSFQLAWKAPADHGQRVAGYDVRYARSAITPGNFDDASVTTAVTYTGMPAAPGVDDGIAVEKLYIETDYYFAVRAFDAAGNKGDIKATTAPTTAHFLTSLMPGATTDDHLGYYLDGTGDFGSATGNSFTGDTLSDLLVGSFISNKAALYFATSTGYPSTPSVSFSSTSFLFGLTVANAGDIDGDGLADIAMASPFDGNGKIFIFSRKNPPASWGTMNSWPATLTDTQANYVIEGDAGSAGNLFGWPIAPVGNFDGTGSDDLAVAVQTYGGVGRVVIVKGSSSFSSFTVGADPTRTIVIDGAGGNFGSTLLGLGPTSSPLVVSAPGIATVYSFGAVAAGPLTAGAASDSAVFSDASSVYGYSFGYLGPLGASTAAIAVAATGLASQFVDIHLGTAATPFMGPAGGLPAPALRITGPTGNSWGALNVGGGVPASNRHVSFIGGDDVPDLILAGQSNVAGPLVYMVDGNVLTSTTGTLSITDPTALPPGVIVLRELPADWEGYGLKSSVVPDVNGDGYGDFAIGEATVVAAGRTMLFY
jgi:hypothetical protein